MDERPTSGQTYDRKRWDTGRALFFLSGCSSVGRMPGLGPGCPPFESEYPDHIFILEVSRKIGKF